MPELGNASPVDDPPGTGWLIVICSAVDADDRSRASTAESTLALGSAAELLELDEDAAPGAAACC